MVLRYMRAGFHTCRRDKNSLLTCVRAVFKKRLTHTNTALGRCSIHNFNNRSLCSPPASEIVESEHRAERFQNYQTLLVCTFLVLITSLCFRWDKNNCWFLLFKVIVASVMFPTALAYLTYCPLSANFVMLIHMNRYSHKNDFENSCRISRHSNLPFRNRYQHKGLYFPTTCKPKIS